MFLDRVKFKEYFKTTWKKNFALSLLIPLATLINVIRYLDIKECRIANNVGFIILGFAGVYVFILACLSLSSFIASFFYKDRKEKLVGKACFFLLSVLFTLGSFKLGFLAEGIAIKRAMIRGESIINSIIAFKAENDKFPFSLNSLSPKYLQNTPTTGYCSAPDFKYHFDSKENDFELTASFGVINWSVIKYTPSEKYEGATKRYGKWAYYVD